MRGFLRASRSGSDHRRLAWDVFLTAPYRYTFADTAEPRRKTLRFVPRRTKTRMSQVQFFREDAEAQRRANLSAVREFRRCFSPP